VRVVVILWTVVVALGCADPTPSVYPTQNLYVEDSTAGPSDVLEIRVAKQEPLSGDFEVDATGVITFPYAGTIQSAGKTPLEIQTDIQTRLAAGYLRDPQVTVRFKERRSKKVSVFGEVRRGTIIPFADGMTIAEAISVAGGFTPRAWENAVKVTRKSARGIEEFTVPVKGIASGSAPTFYMRPGDSVYVPKSPM
jgi:polysaccharide export outer membrane protein